MEKIIIGKKLLEKLSKLFNFNQFSKIGLLTDENIAHHWLSRVKKAIGKETSAIVVPAGEKIKTIDGAKIIWKEMLSAGFDRHSLLINLGGGVIGDLGGFAASTFMRGIDFLQVPTSLLAMVDASIGGKTGIDVGAVKNSVGVFKDPIGVVVDVDVLRTLPARELRSGFAEVIKHGIITDRKHFDSAFSKSPEEFGKEELIKLIAVSIKIKMAIVRKDPKEKGFRKVLNFGHTIGHAIESMSLKTNSPLLHGEAVALGMVAESKLAQLLGLLSEEDFEIIENVINHAGLPVRTNLSQDKIISLIAGDKKNIGKKILWSLPEKIGSVKFDVVAPDELVVEAIDYIKI